MNFFPPAKAWVPLLFAACLLPATASAQKTLRYSDHQPLGEMRTNFLNTVLFPAIEKESNGRLKIEARWNGERAKAYDALGAVRAGQVTDMATAVPEYTAKDLPLHQIFKSFPVGPSGDRQVDFFRRVYAEVPAFSEEFKKNNVTEIFLGTGYPVAFFGTQPLNSLADIQGHTWRSASFWHLDFLRNAGATPVTMHWGEEIPKALQARTLDGLMVNVDSGYNLKVYEHAPHVLVSKDLWLGHLYPVVMNQATWNSLSQEDRSAIERAAASAYKALGAEMNRSLAAQLDALNKVGAKVRVLSSQEVTAFQTATRFTEVQANWAKQQEAQGVADATSTLKKVQGIMASMAR